MSVLTPTEAKGALFLSGTSAFRTGDDSSDKMVSGAYSHEPLEYSATEADEIKSFLMLVQAMIMSGGLAVQVRNETGSTITRGSLVYPSGYSAGNTRYLITKADADSAATHAHFVMADDLATATNGVAYAYRDVLGDVTYPVDTSAYSVGDKVFLSATIGGFSTKPTGADQIAQWVGVVITVHATAGKIRFFPGAHRLEAIGTSGLQADSVTNAKLDNVAQATIKGGAQGAGTANPTDLTIAQAQAIVNAEAILFPGDISPTQLAANTDDWAPTGFSTASVIRLSTDASRNLTGIAAGADGRAVFLFNIGSFNLVLKHNTTSSAANRFATPGSVDYALLPGAGALIIYDSTSSLWRVVARTAFLDSEGDPGAVTQTAADGTSEYAARRDHVHVLGDAALTGLSALASSVDADHLLIHDSVGNALKKVLRSVLLTEPSFSVHRNGVDATGASDAAAGAHTKIKFTTEMWDDGGYYAIDADDSGDATESRFTPLIAGKYLFEAMIPLVNLADAKQFIPELYKNGSIYKYGTYIYVGAAGYQGMAATWIVDMNGSTDYVELYVFNGDASDRDIYGNATQGVRMSGVRVSA